MAKTKIPDPLTRRLLIEKNLGKGALDIADAYLAAGRKLEAVEFLVKAEANDRLQTLLDEAVGTGDVFAIQVISRAMGKDVSRETWQQAAGAAEASGFERYAITAHRQARREDD